MPTVTYRKVACVVHQAHTRYLPETLRCLGKHCGLHWSTACFYMVRRENTVSTTKYRHKFLFPTPLPNRTTIYNYVERFRATGSISGNITCGGYALGKNCARQEDRGRPRRTDSTRTASGASASSAAEFIPRVKNITVRRLYDTGSEARLTSDLCKVVFSWGTLQRTDSLHFCKQPGFVSVDT